MYLLTMELHPGENFSIRCAAGRGPVIDTQTTSVEEGVKQVLDVLRQRGSI